MQSIEWKRAAKGIRYRLHPTRKHGKQADRYYVIRYAADGQKKQEALGWASDGWTLDKVQEQLSKLKASLKTGEGPQSLADKRRIAKVKAEKAELERQEEARKSTLLRDFYTTHYQPWKSLSKPVAFEKEESHWKHWIAPLFGDTAISSIRLEQWYVLANKLRQAGLTQRSIEYICGTLRRILKHAAQQGFPIESIPPAAQIGATAPKDNRRLRVLTQEELEQLMKALKKRDLFAWRISIFSMLVGCRFSDAARLLWGHIDFERKAVSLVKTKTIARIIPVGDEQLSFLKEFGPGQHQDHVFVSSRGGPYHEAPTAFKTTVDELKLNEGRAINDRFSFHNLRHMAATDLARALPLRDLMDYMGWKTPAMALRYMHGNEEMQRSAIAAREKQLVHVTPNSESENTNE